MNYIFKIKTILLVLVAVFFSSSAIAQESFIPQVSIQNVQVDKESYEAGEVVSGSFVMTNHSKDFLDGLYYSISVVGYSAENEPRYVYDTVKVKNLLSFNSNEKKEIKFTYTAPRYIDGEMSIEVNAMFSNHTPLGWGNSKKVSFVGEVHEVYFNSYNVVTNDGKKYGLEEGPTIRKEGPAAKVSFSYDLYNYSDESVKVKPVINIFKQFEPDTILKTITGDVIFLGKEGKTGKTEIELPLFDYTAGVYSGTVDFIDENGYKRTQTLPLRYVVGGDVATIHSFTSKQQTIKEGDSLELSVSYSGSPIDIANPKLSENSGDDFVLSIEIFNEKDVVIASFSTTTPADVRTYNIQTTVTEDALALRGVARITKDGKVLFEKKTIFSERYEEVKNNIGYVRKVAISLVAALLIIIAYYLILRRFDLVSKKYVLIGISITVLILIAIYALYPFSKLNSSTEVSWAGGRLAEGSVYINTPIEGSTQDAGKPFVLSGRASYVACYNHASTFTYNGYMKNPNQDLSKSFSTGAKAEICKTRKECDEKKDENGRTVKYNCKTVKYDCHLTKETHKGNYYPAFTFYTSAIASTTNEAFLRANLDNTAEYDFNAVHKVTFKTDYFGQCGSAHETTVELKPSGLQACSFGEEKNMNFVVSPTNTGKHSWECLNSQNGFSNSCSANFAATCGSSNDSFVSSAPKTNLCELGGGKASSVTTNAIGYTWTCTGEGDGNIQSCAAYKAAACGSSASLVPVKTMPKTNLCITSSTPSPVVANTATGDYEWTCSNKGDGNVANCSVPAVSTCGTLGDTGTDKIAAGRSVTPASVGLCAVENSLLGQITVNYGNGLWSWACQNVAQPPADSCSAQCANNTYYCENTKTCSATCADWCPASVAGNPSGGQTIRKSFLEIDESGKCSISQIDKFYLRPAIADKDNSCFAFWSIKATSTDRTVTCSIDEEPVPCSTTLSQKKAVSSGDHVFSVRIGVDQSVPADKIPDYYITQEQKAKCMPNPAFKEQ